MAPRRVKAGSAALGMRRAPGSVTASQIQRTSVAVTARSVTTVRPSVLIPSRINAQATPCVAQHAAAPNTAAIGNQRCHRIVLEMPDGETTVASIVVG